MCWGTLIALNYTIWDRASQLGDALKFYLDQRFDRVLWWEPEVDPPTAEEEKENEKEAAKEDAHMEDVAA